jgi:hypothetical protein
LAQQGLVDVALPHPARRTDGQAVGADDKADGLAPGPPQPVGHPAVAQQDLAVGLGMGMADTAGGSTTAGRGRRRRGRRRWPRTEGRVDHIEQRHLFGLGGITTGGHGRRF